MPGWSLGLQCAENKPLPEVSMNGAVCDTKLQGAILASESVMGRDSSER